VFSPGRFSIGVEPEIVLSGNTDATLFLHGGFGIAGGYAAHVKFGFGRSAYNDDPSYIGGMLDFRLLSDRRGTPGVFVSFGASSLGKVSLDNQFNIHNDFGQVSLYGGIDDSLTFYKDAAGTHAKFPIELIMGAEFDVTRPFHLIAEGGINLHRSASFISFGLRFYFL